jgi:protein-S-isoprenylcysteine O-methyltransferase Ste14
MLAAGDAALRVLVAGCWGVFLATWILGAAYNTWRAPSPASGYARFRFLPGWVVLAALVFVIARLLPAGVWAPITFWNPLVGLVGAVVLVGSTLLALWARWTLGQMWSSIPMLKEHHELRTGGPYQITRHPIYTGILGMVLGTAMVTGFGPTLVALLVTGAVFVYRIPREERLMTDAFGDRYIRYQQQVPRLIPFVRL